MSKTFINQRDHVRGKWFDPSDPNLIRGFALGGDVSNSEAILPPSGYHSGAIRISPVPFNPSRIFSFNRKPRVEVQTKQDGGTISSLPNFDWILQGVSNEYQKHPSYPSFLENVNRRMQKGTLTESSLVKLIQKTFERADD